MKCVQTVCLILVKTAGNFSWKELEDSSRWRYKIYLHASTGYLRSHLTLYYKVEGIAYLSVLYHLLQDCLNQKVHFK